MKNTTLQKMKEKKNLFSFRLPFVRINIVVVVIVVDIGGHDCSYVESTEEEGDELEGVQLGVPSQVSFTTVRLSWEPDYRGLPSRGLHINGFLQMVLLLLIVNRGGLNMMNDNETFYSRVLTHLLELVVKDPRR